MRGRKCKKGKHGGTHAGLHLVPWWPAVLFGSQARFEDLSGECSAQAPHPRPSSCCRSSTTSMWDSTLLAFSLAYCSFDHNDLSKGAAQQAGATAQR